MPAVNRYSLPQLKQIMKENKIKGTTTMNKPEILTLLHEKGLIPADALVQQEKPKKVCLPKYEFTKYIRCSPIKVIIRDIETGIETEYSSLYKASRTLGCSRNGLKANNGKIWKDKYEIKL